MAKQLAAQNIIHDKAMLKQLLYFKDIISCQPHLNVNMIPYITI